MLLNAKEDSFLWAFSRVGMSFPILVHFSSWDIEIQRSSSTPNKQWRAVMTSVPARRRSLLLTFPMGLTLEASKQATWMYSEEATETHISNL